MAAPPQRAIQQLVAVNCLMPETLSLSVPILEDLKPLIMPSIQRDNPNISSLGDVMFMKVSCVIPTPLLDSWSKYLKPPRGVPPDGGEQDEGEWPPPSGWGFQVAEFAYQGTVYPLHGKLRALLERLARAGTRRRLTVSDLKKDVWGDDLSVEDATIRGCISDLRTELCKLLKLPTRRHLISCKDGGYRLELR